jgi:hypothetical protein
MKSILPLFKLGTTEKHKEFISMKIIHKDNRQMIDSLMHHQITHDINKTSILRSS